jgi:8-oxo-dGTP diphosphatase
MNESILQFGSRRSGVSYVDRPSVYGLALNDQGRLAVAEISSEFGLEYDLPGGGVEVGETERLALIREFAEEVGLPVKPERLLLRANQYWNKPGITPRNSIGSFWQVEVNGTEQLPVDPDHRLIWIDPMEAMRRMRHDAQAWAILYFLRSKS